jgi:hypothetical protein
MEKPGMDRIGFFRRSGLLGLFLACSLFLYGKELSVEVWTSPENPIRGAPWTVSILVAHPVPTEVTVRPPALPPAFTLEQVRTEPRIARWASNERWTAVEFTFIPTRAGEFRLDAFEITTPDNRVRTPPLVFRVRWEDGIDREYNPRLRWDLSSTAVSSPVTEPVSQTSQTFREGLSLRVGERADLALVLSDWDPRLARPEQFPLKLTAPEGALLEELPVSASEAERGIIFRLRIIPLEAADFSLTFPHSLNLAVPGIRIRAANGPGGNGAAGPPAEAAAPAGVPGKTAESRSPLEMEPWSPPMGPFPEMPAPFLFRGVYRRNAAAARTLWDQGRRPEALALLRRNEGSRFAGFTLAPLRREAEQVLGLENTEDEKWRPPVFLILVSLAGLVPLSILLGLKKRVTSGLSWGYKGIALVSALALAAGVMGLADRALDRSPRAVLRACTAYRVPGALGAEEFRFPEGLPAAVRAEADSWVYVESAEGNAGWVLRENLVYY